MQNNQTFEVRDIRVKEKFFVDDRYLNGYAKILSDAAFRVYISLCRHADLQQEAFPSIDLLAEQHGKSRSTILRGIKELKKYSLIATSQKRSDNGLFLHNTYVLLDKSQWNMNGVSPMTLGNGGSPMTPTGGHPRHYKETHTKETHTQAIISKDIISSASQRKIYDTSTKNISLTKPTQENKIISFLLAYMKERLSLTALDDSLKKNRQYCATLLKKYKPKDIQKMIDYAADSEFWSHAVTSFIVLHRHGSKILKSAQGDSGYHDIQAAKKFMNKHGL